ncbi:hypothetical protein [Burkholderia vietnamiensis]|uniref:hypothetical protein n=1 Tax=Burkholderia vietnamiensis TaxID=60552 RepID=UPI001CF38551|nr:hypothetical protein [Burkholderia vietnamiensis]MCA8194099.1 hypothetical protein [Burkholderia vietnamiensis]
MCGRDAAQQRLTTTDDGSGAGLHKPQLRAALFQFPHLRVQLGYARAGLFERTSLLVGRHHARAGEARVRGFGAIDLTLDFRFRSDTERFPRPIESLVFTQALRECCVGRARRGIGCGLGCTRLLSVGGRRPSDFALHDLLRLRGRLNCALLHVAGAGDFALDCMFGLADLVCTLLCAARAGICHATDGLRRRLRVARHALQHALGRARQLVA